MSPRLKNVLMIGGIALAAVVVCGVAIVLVLGPVAGSRLNRAASYPEYDYVESAEGYPEPAMEAPAEESGYGGGAEIQATYVAVTQGEQPIERLIIRNGYISMTVQDTVAAHDQIVQRVEAMAGEGAFVVSSNQYESSPGASPYINLSIRVPAERFDETMEWLKSLAVQGTNPTVNETAQDVTEEYVDIDARVRSLEAARDRLLELMQGAETTEDLLMAEQQLTQREAEIESLKGRMRYLAESARLSMISIDLQPYILSQPVDTRWRPAETFRRAIEALVEGGRDFGDFLIYFAIAVLPWLLLLALVIYGIVRFIMWRVRVGQRTRAERAALPPTE